MTGGRLFKLRLDKSRDARAAALATVRPDGDGWWAVRVGGPVRGSVRRYGSRRRAEQAVNDHYDRAMMRHVTVAS